MAFKNLEHEGFEEFNIQKHQIRKDRPVTDRNTVERQEKEENKAQVEAELLQKADEQEDYMSVENEALWTV